MWEITYELEDQIFFRNRSIDIGKGVEEIFYYLVIFRDGEGFFGGSAELFFELHGRDRFVVPE